MFQKRTSPMHYTFTDVIAVAAFSVIAVIVTVNGGVPQKALFSIEPAGAPKEVPLMSISQRTYVEVDHWRSLARYSINPYGSSARITSASSATLKSVEEKPGFTGEDVHMYGSTAWVRGGTSPAQKVESARLAGVAGKFFNPYGSTAWVRGDPSELVEAEPARLSGLAGEFINLYGSTAWVRGDPSGSVEAEAARLSGLAGEFINLYGSTAWVRGDPSGSVEAESVRLSGLAGEFFNPFGSTAWVRGNPSDTGKAEAARLVAAGKAFGIIPHYISVELASFSNR